MKGTQRPDFRDPDFVPPRCPYLACTAHAPGARFTYRRRGNFVRKLDGERVQRFQCTVCMRSFSSQTFRLDYRLRRPDTLAPIFTALCSKTTLRKTARNLGLGRDHVARRMRLLGAHARRYHERQLERVADLPERLGARFQFDELETYEEHRKLKPVTVAVLIEQRTGFVVHTDVETLPARKPLRGAQKKQLEAIEAKEGKRRSGSRRAVARTVEALERVARHTGRVEITTDRKASYRAALRRTFGDRVQHRRIDGRMRRGVRNPLFPINHTLARLRDLASRLVRQTWAAAKRRAALADQLAVIVAFRNYVDGWRSEPAVRQKTTAAVQLGLLPRKLTAAEYLVWMDPLVERA